MRDFGRKLLDKTRSALDIDHPYQPPPSDAAHLPQSVHRIKISRNNFHAQHVSIQVTCNHSSDSSGEALRPAGRRPQLKRCPPSVRTFTGRNDILAQMREYFFNDSHQHMFFLYGLGGAGKTQIALKFVEMCQAETVPRFSNVYFVDASTTKTIVTDLTNIALTKQIGESWQDTLDWLAMQHDEWLLLLNNADDTTLNLRDYFPRCAHGNILITSRNRDIIQHAPDVHSYCHVSGMHPNDAIDLLFHVSGLRERRTGETEAVATAIVKELGYLALAVVQAGAFVLRSECSLDRYLKLYRERRGVILEESPDIVQKMDDYEGSVYTTWSISFKRLSAQSVKFLQLCAFLHHDGISETIFRNAVSNMSTYEPEPPKPKFRFFFTKRTPAARSLNTTQESGSSAKDFLAAFRTLGSGWDSEKFLKMITEIRSYSLVEFDTGNQSYSIHPLVHAWILTTISDGDAICACTQWILWMSITWGHHPEDYTFRRSLHSHIDHVLEGGNPIGPEFYEEFGCVYLEAGRWKEAEQLLLQVRDTRLRMLGAEHSDTLLAMENLMATYWRQGRLEEAEELGLQVRDVRLRVLGAEHSDTLLAMEKLAATYWRQGRSEEAEELGLQVRDARLRILGAEHPYTLRATGCVATIFKYQGRWKEAEDLELKVRDACLRVLGAEHPDTLRSKGNLAATYWHQGRWKEAEELQLQVRDAHLKVLGAEHPDTLSTIGGLALTYWSQGRWKEAEELQLQVRDACLRLFEGEHPDTLRALACLAATYRHQGRWKEAEDIELKVRDARLRVLGAENPDTLRSKGSLAATYWHQGRWKEAEELQLQVRDVRLKMLGAGHPDTLSAIGDLALTYQYQGRWKEAEELQLQVRDACLGSEGEHPYTLWALACLAATYRHQGRWKEAEDIELKVRDARLRVLGAEDPDTLRSKGNLAATYWHQGRWKEAEELQLQVRNVRLGVLGAGHPDTLLAIGDLALTYRCQGRWKEAEELQLQAHDSSLRVRGVEHPDTLQVMRSLAETYNNQGRWKEAEELQLRTHVLCHKVLGAEHPDTLKNMSNLVVTYNNQGRWKEAEELQLQVQVLCHRVLGPEHPDSLKNMANLLVTQSRAEEGGGGAATSNAGSLSQSAWV